MSKGATGNAGPAANERIWLPRKTLGMPSPPSRPELELPPRRRDRLRLFVRNHQILLLISGLVLPAAFPFLFDGQCGGSGVQNQSGTLLAMVMAPEPGEPCEPETEEETDPEINEDEFEEDAAELLHTIGSEDFEAPEKVATGRFLAVLDQRVPFIKGIDMDRVRTLSRGPGWARMEAVFSPLKHLFGAEEEEKFLILELVEEEAHWKLEYMKVTSRRSR